MDRVDLEALALRLIDKVKRHGYAAEYGVEDVTTLREFLEREARRCGFQVHMGTLSADEHSVWIYRPKVGGSWQPIAEAGR
ncbi:hypothetical protein GCM10009839_23470 [Catenulispora yoronensis]